MKQFKPSPDFVSRVMQEVVACKPGREQHYFRLLSSPVVRCVMSAAGVLLGLFNLVRLYFSVLSPVVCR